MLRRKTDPGKHTLCEPESRNTHEHCTGAIFCGDLQGKCRPLIPRHPVCASLRSRNAHGHFTRAILYGNLQGKCQTLISGPLFCVSLRSRNAHGHFTRAILCRNLQGKCRTRRLPPRLNTGPHCLGKNVPFSSPYIAICVFSPDQLNRK